ncbi:Uncharacterised protein [Vibrio cholerae]|nr:Uncharacterised protein [Vibrio cholerae]CSI61591.1 Uncharacterised protein [Vibrio cholerae]
MTHKTCYTLHHYQRMKKNEVEEKQSDSTDPTSK